MVRRNVPVPANPEYYRYHLSPSEFNLIVDWQAVERCHFGKAIGKRGGTWGPLARKIKNLREMEMRIPPAPPLAATPAQQRHEPQDVEITDVFEPPYVPAPAPTPAPALNLEVTVANQSAEATAATAYVNKMGNAAAQFMIMMTSATSEFISDTRQIPSAAPQADCSICFEKVKEPYMGQCSHVYCRECLMNPHMVPNLVSESGIEAIRIRACPQCRRNNMRFYKVLS